LEITIIEEIIRLKKEFREIEIKIKFNDLITKKKKIIIK
jgi:hypothetical protein